LADGVDAVGPAHADEVISSDVVEKSLRAHGFPDHGGQDSACNDEDLLTTVIAVAIVERLKLSMSR